MPQSIKKFTQEKIDQVTAVMLSADWTDRKVYGDFLCQTYHHICHSTRMLAAAGSRFPVEQEKLHLQCMHHAGEERSHEKLSVSDLKEIGLSVSEFPELPSTKNLYRSIYCMIDRESPVALLGYAYFLECIAVSKGAEGISATAERAFGKKAVKHVNVHLKEDPEHIEAYEKLLETFSGKDRDALIESIAITAFNYEMIYRQIQERAGRARGGRAA